ncbi:MAG: hypothetical protein HC795_10180 [Coleofasciculaceae cyanobacterium RL_1_1]|nr:hypothetical protein [Coleofasciculaceae cyanobacterium RL_1_1]
MTKIRADVISRSRLLKARCDHHRSRRGGVVVSRSCDVNPSCSKVCAWCW